MYNRLFTRILDSSIWLEPDTTRIVWITMIAAMDEDSFARFACVENLAIRARVSLEAAIEAIRCLESPDLRSPHDEFEGRRIERVPGGWMVLKGPLFKGIFRREIEREQSRIRVERFRAKKRLEADVTHSNDTKRNVAQSTTTTTTETDRELNLLGEGAGEPIFPPPDPSPPPAARRRAPVFFSKPSEDFMKFWDAYPRRQAMKTAWRAWQKIKQPIPVNDILEAVEKQKKKVWNGCEKTHIPLPATWLNAERWDDEL